MIFARLMDVISTLLGIQRVGIDAEMNPIVKFAFQFGLFPILQVFWTLVAIWWGKFTEQENKVYGLIGGVSLVIAIINFWQYFNL